MHLVKINLEKCFEGGNSNMSKLGLDGKPIFNENGKVMKGPNYYKPNLKNYKIMKENFYWIFLGIALGILIYLGDKYLF